MSRRAWTYPELKSAAERFALGESWQSIGDSFGVSAGCVRSLVKKHGLKVERKVKPPRPTDAYNMRLMMAIAIRNKHGLSWPLVAKEIGWEKSPARLRILCNRFVEEGGGSVVGGYPEKRKKRGSSLHSRPIEEE